jgi:gliding motility-associated-like protein
MGKYFKIVFFLLTLILSGTIAYSTHLKAGEILVRRTSVTQFEIQLIIYTDSSSVIGFGVDEPDAEIKISDGTTLYALRDSPGRIYIGNATFKNVYTFPPRQFNSSTYTISYQQDNRNGGVKNMDNSGNTPFYLETILRVSPFIGVNNLPILLIPPIDLAAVGQKYTYNSGAYDIEGDSLSYEFTTPKQNTGTNVVGYQHPNIKPAPAGTFTLDPVTGDLVWDAPVVPGYYNFAFIIKEWRNGQVIGSIVRDMQIEVKNSINKPPVLKLPNDTCVVAGTSFSNLAIVATDPDINDKIILTSKSGLYLLPSSPAGFVVPAPPSNPTTGYFSWSTNCSHVRDEPYQVVFIAQDITPTNQPLFDIQSWRIKVLAPEPTGLEVQAVNKGFQLDWDPYACNNGKMEVYRKVCDSIDNVLSHCENGDPKALGYTKIGEVPIGTTTYKDTVNLNPGSYYYYRISANFAAPKGGRSNASAGACGSVFGAPVPTHATVVKTDSLNGKIKVSWSQPLELDMTTFPGPYQYRLFRATGLTGTNYTLIKTLSNLADTLVIDSLINTRDLAYNYKMEFYYTSVNGLTLKNTSINAASVFLNSTPGGNQVSLSWSFDVPWNNRNQYHRIYRKLQGSNVFELHDSVFVTGNYASYLDQGLVNGDTVCYYIQTQGRYCSDKLPFPLLNNSQVVCEVPRDTQPPCPPILLGPASCLEDGIGQLTINWIPDLSLGCNQDIKGYNVYYAEHEDEELKLLASTVPDTFFVDNDLLSLAGCYTVTALNFYGSESAMSNKICVDLCVYYELPNLISPNRDSLNDVFKPYPVPKNVKQVKFTVFNRWGKRIYYSEDDIQLNWKGEASDGSVVASGIYFFHAEVIYRRRLNRKDEVKNIKGWVQIIRREEEDVHE